MTPQTTIRMESPAKLNVFLEVLGKRADGYHELETLMLRTQLSDSLEFRRTDSGEIRLQLTGSAPASSQHSVPLDESNLIVRAGRALQAATGCALGCDVIMEKRIPPESGLAGGSSNAAATLRALNTLWELNEPDTMLHAIAATLGSDINFLLTGARAAVCRGRGENVEPVEPDRTLYFVATRPIEGNRTSDVFRATQLTGHPRPLARTMDWLHDAGVPPAEACFNRLTDAARRLNPAMAELMDRLQSELHKPVFMSGSGSTCFVVAQHAVHAATLRDEMLKLTDQPVWLLQC